MKFNEFMRIFLIDIKECIEKRAKMARLSDSVPNSLTWKADIV